MSKKTTTPSLGSRVRKMIEEDACYVMRARRLSRLVSRAYDEALRDCEITGPQFTLLISLAATGPLQAVKLVNEFDIEKSTLSRTVKRMIQSGWIEERKETGAAKTLALTPLGEETLERALPHWQSAQIRARNIFSEDGSNALNQLIEKAHAF